MGRIKTTLVKRVSNKLIKDNPGKFKEDFNTNKKIVLELADVPSKKLRNVMAGYLTRLVRQNKDQKTI
ncbi:MAG: 30S ribosomal protein S17e [Nanoarchaeota archaeon]